MFEIINKQILAEGVKRVDVAAPNIARKIQPGQFVSVCPEEGDERIPLTVVETDQRKGTITLIFQEKGVTTGKLGSLPIHDSLFAVVGPLGVPSKVEKVGTIVCIATGVGTAQILPICRSFRKAGNKVIGIIGAKSKRSLMLEPQMRLSCNKLHIATDDGTYERRGQATDVLKELMLNKAVDLVYAIGSIDMMRTVCSLTKIKKIDTRVQLNPVMVDCMGMCGSCRVKIAGKIVLACMKGPEFDGHKVDFDDFSCRMKACEESDECRNQKSQSSSAKNVSGILTKFLSGILKK